ncbi:MAG: hypothetical protein B7Z39_01990 [Novosphingobium sp. 12-64-8]|nr:MAG: hypothetical protein B7Z39_01990 [Novosphingobium sp. 12-64-8]
MALPAGSPPCSFVYTTDRARSLPFYADILGLSRRDENPFAVTFDLGGGATLQLVSLERHEPSPHPVVGWTVPDIRNVATLLAAKGVAMQHYEGMGQDELGICTHGESRMAWFLDPEGNCLMLTQLG